jgi:hypothetical protein
MFDARRFRYSTNVAALYAAASDPYSALLALSPAIVYAPSLANSCFQERTGAAATTPSTNGTVVGSMKDFGSLGAWATAPSDAARPILRVSGALTYLEFDGVDDVLDFTTGGASVFQNTGSGTLAAAHRFRSSPTSLEYVLQISRDAAASNRAIIGAGNSSGKWSAGGRRLDADSVSILDSAASVSTGAPVTHIAEFDWTNSDLYQYINNALDGSNTSFQTAGSTSNTASASCRIGSMSGSGFADIDFYGATISAPILTRATVQAWLASVAGL